MKLTLRQLVSPIFVTLSLTSFGAILLYYVLRKKKKKDTDSIEEPTVRSKTISVPIKIPQHYLYTIVSKADVIKDIENKTDTLIQFFKASEIKKLQYPYSWTYPYNQDPICLIKGSEENAYLAAARITNLVLSQPVIDDYVLSLHLEDIQMLEERNCEIVQTIQTLSQTKIVIEQNNNMIVTNDGIKSNIYIRGNANQVTKAVRLIQKELRRRYLTTKVFEDKKMDSEYKERVKFSTTKTCTSPSSQQTTTINNADISESDLKAFISSEIESLPPLLKNYNIINVIVTSIDTPDHFWIRFNDKELFELEKKMNDDYNDMSYKIYPLQKVKIGEKVAIKSVRIMGQQAKWYRVEVVSVLKENTFEIFYLDYGSFATFNGTLYKLGSTFSTSNFRSAKECTLANVTKRSYDWKSDSCEKFVKYTCMKEQRYIYAKLRGYVSHDACCLLPSHKKNLPIACLELYNNFKKINVGKALIKRGLAKYYATKFVITLHAILKYQDLKDKIERNELPPMLIKTARRILFSDYISNKNTTTDISNEQSNEQSSSRTFTPQPFDRKASPKNFLEETPREEDMENKFLLTGRAMENIYDHIVEHENHRTYGFEKIFVCGFETPNNFWIQPVGGRDVDITWLNAIDIKSYYNRKETHRRYALTRIREKQEVMAKSSKNGMWYHGRITKVLRDSKCKVEFLEYGGCEIISNNNLLDSREKFSRRWAKNCSLNVEPLDAEWSEEALRQFENLVCPMLNRILLRHTVWANVLNYHCLDLHVPKDPLIPVSETISVGEMLVKMGLARFKRGYKTSSLDEETMADHIKWQRKFYDNFATRPDTYLSSLSDCNDENITSSLSDCNDDENIKTYTPSQYAEHLIGLMKEEDRSSRENILCKEEFSNEEEILNSSDNLNSTAESISLIQKDKLNDLGDLIEVYIWNVNTPNQFWIRVRGSDITAVDNLNTEMTSYYGNSRHQFLHVLRKIKKGQMVAAKYKDEWRRAIIMYKNKFDYIYEVYFVDIGVHTEVLRGDILELRDDMLKLEWQTIECSLANVRPIRRSHWDEEANNKFNKLTLLENYVKIKGYKRRPVGPPIIYVDIYGEDKEFNVGEIMLRLNYAQYEVDMDLETDLTLLPNIEFSLSEYKSLLRKNPLRKNLLRKNPLRKRRPLYNISYYKRFEYKRNSDDSSNSNSLWGHESLLSNKKDSEAKSDSDDSSDSSNSDDSIPSLISVESVHSEVEKEFAYEVDIFGSPGS